MNWVSEIEAGRADVADAAEADFHGVAPERDVAFNYPDMVTDRWFERCYYALAGHMIGGDDERCRVALAVLPSVAAQNRVVAAGVPVATVFWLGAVGDLSVRKVELSRDGTRFEEVGTDARLLLGVRDAYFDLVDVVALASHDENQWSLLTGHGEMLGEWWLDDIDRRTATERPARLKLHATPWDWLRAGGDGVCVLNWNRAVLAHLRSLGERVTIEVANAAERAKLKARFERGGQPLVSAGPLTSQGVSLAERFAMGGARGRGN